MPRRRSHRTFRTLGLACTALLAALMLVGGIADTAVAMPPVPNPEDPPEVPGPEPEPEPAPPEPPSPTFDEKQVRPPGLCSDLSIPEDEPVRAFAGSGPCTALPPAPPKVPGGTCAGAPGTLDRPAGAIPPGYIFEPTLFDGTPRDPQPDDTFAGDGAGHPVHTGRLTTRVANGREEFLVCAHLGTNNPDYWFTPFASFLPVPHAATIAPRVILTDAAGHESVYTIGTPGLTDAKVAHYDGSTEVREGYVRMWIPFAGPPAGAKLTAPGFQVRVEVRGTAALPYFGSNAVTGADEVQVHLGPPPVTRNAPVEQAVGLALDDGVVAERHLEDPGPDDLRSVLDAVLRRELPPVAEGLVPPEGIDYPESYEWRTDKLGWVETSAHLNHIYYTHGSLAKLDISDFSPTESTLYGNIVGTTTLNLTATPRSIGAVSIRSGQCGIIATAYTSVWFGAKVNLSPDRKRLSVQVSPFSGQATLTNVLPFGTLNAHAGPIPLTYTCEEFADEITSGIQAKLTELVTNALRDPATSEMIAAKLDPKLAKTDLATGPFSTLGYNPKSGGGFGLADFSYVQTAPRPQFGGDVHVWHDGVDAAVNGAVTDKGSDRFPLSARPAATQTVLQATHGRARPGAGGAFDVGAVINGASVNQLLRAVTAGGVAEGSGQFDSNDGLVAVRPSSAPQYLPTPPATWPLPARAVAAYIPSLRVTTPLPQTATMTVDIRAGVDVTLDQTNRLVWSQPALDIRPRFLHLGRSINAALERDATGRTPTEIEKVSILIDRDVRTEVRDMLTPINLPDLSAILLDQDLPPVTLSHLSVGTVGGGHLGIFVDVDPNPGKVDVPVTWGGSPHSATITANMTGFPGTGDYTIEWRVKDAVTGALVYWANGSSATTVTIPTSSLRQFVFEPCTGMRFVRVVVDVTVSRGGVTNKGHGDGKHTWQGPSEWNPNQCGGQL